MIPVVMQPEPASFDIEVRKKGKLYLSQIDLSQIEIAKLPYKPFWRQCLPQLHKAYEGVCAYLCVYIELPVGGATVDHCVAKSKQPVFVYEWSNYRLACAAMNTFKNNYDDVLDPFSLSARTFCLELTSGRIYPNPELAVTEQKLAAERTIKRLRLDAPNYRELRARHFSDFVQGYFTEAYLKRISPFVWLEAQRLNLL